MTLELLNCSVLAERMGKKPGYVSAMKAAGYKFEFGNQTTLRHALRWRRQHKQFRTTAYYRAHRQRPDDEKAVRANKRGARGHSNGQCNP